jgi:DNA-binding MarR family transcriptional regulator
MGGANPSRMDAVMFDLKAAHLSVQRVGRMFAKPYGLTVARFDLMNALGVDGMFQKDLWKRLNVTRSVICEMLGALLELGWVKRVRASDKRTWLVTLTEMGRAVFRRCFEETVNNGEVVGVLERGLEKCHGNTLSARETLWWYCKAFLEAYRTRPYWFGEDLYLCDPEDYYEWFIEPGTISFGLPWANELPTSFDVECP